DIGGYDATIPSRGADCCEDLKFNLDIAERFDFDVVPEFLFSYRVRAGSMSTNVGAMLRSRRVVIEEARARHPELPDKLFRWARGHQHREFGLTYLGDGHLMTGAYLLLKALGEDPFATLRLGTQRIYARFSRLLGAKQRGGLEPGKLERKFLEVDPTVFVEQPRATWTPGRLAYIAAIPIRR